MSAIWNFMNPLRNGHMKLLGSGREFYGTVIKNGVNAKTCTVRVDYQFFNKKYQQWHRKSSNFQVHDEEQFCQQGDKVVIKHCEKISKSKHYFVRNVVKQFPNNDYYKQFEIETEQQKLFNEKYKEILKKITSEQSGKVTIRNSQQLRKIKHDMKMQALSKAHQDLKTVSKRTTQLNKLERMRMGLEFDEEIEKVKPQVEVEQQTGENVDINELFEEEYENLMKNLQNHTGFVDMVEKVEPKVDKFQRLLNVDKLQSDYEVINFDETIEDIDESEIKFEDLDLDDKDKKK